MTGEDRMRTARQLAIAVVVGHDRSCWLRRSAQAPAGDTRADHAGRADRAPAAASTPSAGVIAEKLQERLKQPVVVENRAGAGGMVGADYVAKAAPDGHTLLLMESSAVLHKWLHKSVPFDVIDGFRADRAGRDLAAAAVRAIRRFRRPTSRS